MGRFGIDVASYLTSYECSVLAIDKNRQVIDEIDQIVDSSLCLDSTNEIALIDAGIENIDVAICAFGDKDVQASIMTTALLAQLGVKEIIVRASTDLQAKILEKIGATKIIIPERDSAKFLAKSLMNYGFEEHLEIYGNAIIGEFVAPDSFIGKSIEELRIRSRYDVNIIGVWRRSDSPKDNKKKIIFGISNQDEIDELHINMIFNINPKIDFSFIAGDRLVVVGTREAIQSLSEKD